MESKRRRQVVLVLLVAVPLLVIALAVLLRTGDVPEEPSVPPPVMGDCPEPAAQEPVPSAPAPGTKAPAPAPSLPPDELRPLAKLTSPEEPNPLAESLLALDFAYRYYLLAVEESSSYSSRGDYHFDNLFDEAEARADHGLGRFREHAERIVDIFSAEGLEEVRQTIREYREASGKARDAEYRAENAREADHYEEMLERIESSFRPGAVEEIHRRAGAFLPLMEAYEEAVGNYPWAVRNYEYQENDHGHYGPEMCPMERSEEVRKAAADVVKTRKAFHDAYRSFRRFIDENTVR
ncbi:MAG: hypothetical protein ACYTAF_13025 [Planctomycetota bacterium]|jgi:hypothetical protein